MIGEKCFNNFISECEATFSYMKLKLCRNVDVKSRQASRREFNNMTVSSQSSWCVGVAALENWFCFGRGKI